MKPSDFVGTETEQEDLDLLEKMTRPSLETVQQDLGLLERMSQPSEPFEVENFPFKKESIDEFGDIPYQIGTRDNPNIYNITKDDINLFSRLLNQLNQLPEVNTPSVRSKERKLEDKIENELEKRGIINEEQSDKQKADTEQVSALFPNVQLR